MVKCYKKFKIVKMKNLSLDEMENERNWNFEYFEKFEN